MTVLIKAAAITALKANTALTTLLGGQHIYPGHVSATQQIPGCYVTASDRSKPRPGYNSSKHRDNSPTLTVDVFHGGTAAQADTLAAAVDTALMTAPIAGTHGWSSTITEQFEEDTLLHHRTVRFSFAYSLQD